MSNKLGSLLISKLLTCPSIFWSYDDASESIDFDVTEIFKDQRSMDDYKHRCGKKAFLKASSIFVASFLLEKEPKVDQLLVELSSKEKALKRHWGKDKFNHLVFLLESFKAQQEGDPLPMQKQAGLLKRPGLLALTH